MTFHVYFSQSLSTLNRVDSRGFCLRSVSGEPATGLYDIRIRMAAPEGYVTWRAAKPPIYNLYPAHIKGLVNNQAKQKMTTNMQAFVGINKTSIIRSFHSADRIGHHTRTRAQINVTSVY